MWVFVGKEKQVRGSSSSWEIRIMMIGRSENVRKAAFPILGNIGVSSPLEVGSSTASVLGLGSSLPTFADISKKRGFGSGESFVHRPVSGLSSRSSS